MITNKSAQQIHKEGSIAWLAGGEAQNLIPKNYPVSTSGLIDLERQIKGKIVYPWSNGYDVDKQDFNNVFPVNPVMIIYVANYGDIRFALSFANSTAIIVAIRSGGHSLAGYSVCDGIVIDISLLKSSHVFPDTKTIFVEAGCTFADIFPSIEFYGLHMPGGGCPTVSVSGYMQGGGYGMTSRTFGMHCDCVIEIQVMLADGKIVKANNNHNPDLFWAVRGGTGGNFGVLLNITYQLVDLGNIWGVKAEWEISPDALNAANVLFTIQEKYLQAGADPQLGIQTILNTGADLKKRITFLSTWTGNETDLDVALAPLLNIPGADLAFKKTGRYSEINTALLGDIPPLPPNVPFCAFSRSIYIESSLSTENWVDILKFFLTALNQYTIIDMEGYGGKINEIPVETNAFIHRNVKMDFFCDVFFNEQTDDRKANEEWQVSLFQFMEKYGNGHSYQNYPNRKQEDFRWAYWGDYYNILVAVKKKYDPQNFFRYQQSIGLAEAVIIGTNPNVSFDQKNIEYENF